MTQSAVISAPVKTQQSLEEKLQSMGVLRPTVFLSVEKSLSRLTTVNDFTLAEAFRQTWTCQPLKKKLPPTLAICHSRGVILKVYKDLTWTIAWSDTEQRLLRTYQSMEFLLGAGDIEKFRADYRRRIEGVVAPLRGRDNLWNFTADEAPEYDHLYKTDLSRWLTQQGMANPVRYVNCD